MSLRWHLSILIGALIVMGMREAVLHPPDPASDTGPFSFAAAADMRQYAGPGIYYSSQYFHGAVEAMAAHSQSVFLVSPGDIDPPANVHWTITDALGLDYTWYPMVGNHEAETTGDMDWLRGYDFGSVNLGPAGCPTTTYSFDYGQAHFVMLNEYCDAAGDTATDGDVPDHLYDWLAADLETASQPHIFVLGHEPAYPQPEADNGRLRHEYDRLNQYPFNRDRFWELLKTMRVTAYICGHTHNYSAVWIDGVWQIDVGHARGLGDTGARSTSILVTIDGTRVTFETYRDDANGGSTARRMRESWSIHQFICPSL